MKKSSKIRRTVVTDSIFINTNSISNESNSDDEKYQLPTVDIILSEEDDKEVISIPPMNTDRHLFENTNEYLPLKKAGCLIVKHWLSVRYDKNIELASECQWKPFWICSKKSNLEFFNNYLDTNPTLTIDIIDSLCYPLSEHFHRPYVFSMTLRTGDTYCFQSSNQSELDDWIQWIHYHCLLETNENFVKLKIKQLEENMFYENKIFKLAQLQSKLSTNEQSHLNISKQIKSCETNLELFYIDLFRYRCYFEALNNNRNLPNSKDLFSQASSITKVILYKLNAFTPCGFYACVTARQRVDCRKSKLRNRQPIVTSPSISSVQCPSLTDQTILQMVTCESNPQMKIIVSINKTDTVGEFLKRTTDKLDLPVDDYFLYFYSTTSNGFVPERYEKLNNIIYSSVKLCEKMIYQIILNNQLNPLGIEIHREYSSKVFVTNVKKRSEGQRLGIIEGDEIMAINKLIVQELDSSLLNYYLNQIPVMLTLRSSRLNQAVNLPQSIIQKSILPTDMITSPIKNDQLSFGLVNTVDELSQFSILKTHMEQPLNTPLLLNKEQIQRVISELVETEVSYVHDIKCLLKIYIAPLRLNSKILSSDVTESLYTTVKSISQLQHTFLEHLKSNLLTKNILLSIADTFINYSKYFKIYSTYCAIHLRLNHVLDYHKTNEYFKEFLSLCHPCHEHSLSFESYLIKPVQRIFKYPLFLEQLFIYCNSKENNRILTLEKSKLKKAIKMMKKISQYINSMQQIYEDFGQSFDCFMNNYIKEYDKTFRLHLSDLYAYGEIDWINIHRFLPGKNHQCLKAFCFIFRNGCLLLVREQLFMKKQDFISNHKINKHMFDRYIRYLPMKELKVELIDDSNTDNTHTWQLIHRNPKTRLITYFCFANKDAHTFMKAINNCISTIKWRRDEDFDVSERSYLLRKCPKQQSLSSSHSCYDLLPSYSSSNQQSDKNTYQRSPSPIWKRRTTSLRKRPLSMTNHKISN